MTALASETRRCPGAHLPDEASLNTDAPLGVVCRELEHVLASERRLSADGRATLEDALAHVKYLLASGGR